MKKWTLLPFALLTSMLAAQSSSPVPAGTALMVRLDTTLATFSNKAGDQFRGSITQPVVINGQTVIPVGSTIEGRVTKVSESRRISGRPTIGILPEAVILPTGERYYLDATLTDTSIRGSDVNSGRAVQGIDPRPERYDRTRRRYGRRDVDWRIGRGASRRACRRSDRGRSHDWTLVVQASLGDASFRNPADLGVEPSSYDGDVGSEWRQQVVQRPGVLRSTHSGPFLPLNVTQIYGLPQRFQRISRRHKLVCDVSLKACVEQLRSSRSH